MAYRRRTKNELAARVHQILDRLEAGPLTLLDLQRDVRRLAIAVRHLIQDELPADERVERTGDEF